MLNTVCSAKSDANNFVYSALNLCNTVTEYQTLDLMKVIIAGLKCNNDDKNSVEFKALSSIVFAYLIPRVQVGSNRTFNWRVLLYFLLNFKALTFYNIHVE